ncbi:MAG: hypothetical protein O3A39_04060 [Proteobacteria bacterium]|nr:hypothetical protein [Pseudomonadota bacterium]
MASYALINKMNIVILVLEDFEENLEDGDATKILGSIEKWEEYYTKQLNHPNVYFKRCHDYENNIRGKYPQIGDIFNEEYGVFTGQPPWRW